MTDLDLQKALADELKAMCREEILKMPQYDHDGNVETFKSWKEYNIYVNDKPYKDEELPDVQEDYIIVVIGDEDTDNEGNWIVEMHIVVSICLFENEHQGNLIIANLMNQIDYRFRTKGIIAGKYEKEPETYKRFNDDCWENYYEADYISKWKLPAINQEGLEDCL